MANLISAATGNFTAAGTWGVVDATSLLDSVANNTALTTSYVLSSAFTPGAITIDGLAVHIINVAASPTGTMSVALDLATVTVVGTEITINVADLHAVGVNDGGWYLFKFAAPILLVGATAYTIKAKTSSATQVNLYRDSTAGNWSRMLRSTTTGAPASGDQINVIGEHTGAGTGNSFTVTMNETATTSYGPTVSGGPPFGMTIGKRGTLTFSTSIAGYFKYKGIVATFGGGTVNVGASGGRVGSSSSVIIEADSAANVDSGWQVYSGGVVLMYGDNARARQTTFGGDEAAAQTVLTITATTGWVNGDEIGMASTTQTASQCEKRTISTVDSATQVTVSVAITNAHSGTNPTKGEIINLTSNVKFRGVSASLCGFVDVKVGGSFTADNVEFYQLGSATALKLGIGCISTATAFVLQACSIHDNTVALSRGVNITGASGTCAILIDDCVFWDNVTAISNVATTNTAWTVSDCVSIKTSGRGFDFLDVGGAVSGLTAVGSATNGISIDEAAATLAAWGALTAHSCTTSGVIIGALYGGSISSVTAWRNGSNGGLVFGSASGSCVGTAINGGALFGNNTKNIGQGSGSAFYIVLTGMTGNGDTTFATTSNLAAAASFFARFDSCDFSSASGILTACTNDIIVSNTPLLQIFLRNTKMAAATEVSGMTGAMPGSFIGSSKHDQTAGLHKWWKVEGTGGSDSVVFSTAAPSEKVLPLSATLKIQSSPKRYFIANGGTVSVSAWVKRGASHAGSQPRMIVRANPAIGFASDVVLDTMTVAAGSSETLTGTTGTATDDGVIEVYWDTDGVTDQINIDDVVFS